ncbi:MAG: hypothetical protein HYV63_18055 [Candidatus Schekmanbacteria bacterium]|nr:hypothetical protein [Candidatus Schekmanbacteria bacterium]
MGRAHRVLLSLALLQLAAASAAVAGTPGAGPGSAPWLHLRDRVEIGVAGRDLGAADGFAAGEWEPLGLAAADLDGDGVPDLVAAYGTGGGGQLVVYRGNIDSLWPETAAARARRARGEGSDAPFLPDARAFAVAIRPAFIASGDLDADGSPEVVVADSGGPEVLAFGADGHGGLGAPRVLAAGGRLTVLAAGDFNRRDGIDDLLVGITGDSGAQLRIFEGPHGALAASPEVVALPRPATALALGWLDDDLAVDVAVAAGTEIVIVHGRDRHLSDTAWRQAAVPAARLSRIAVGAEVAGLAIGDFLAGAPEGRHEVAAVAADGGLRLYHAAEGGFAAGVATARASRGTTQGAGRQLLAAARVSASPAEDLIVGDPDAQLTEVLVLDAGARPAARTPRSLGLLPAGGAVVAALPMQLNVDAVDDLVLLESGTPGPVVWLSVPRASFSVNSTADTSDRDTTDGVCADSDGNCTLRAALQEADVSDGMDTITFNLGAGARIDTGESGVSTISSVTLDGGGSRAVVISGIVYLGGAASKVRNLVINGEGKENSGLAMSGDDSTVEGCYVGTNSAGDASAGPGNGVAMWGSSSTVGGTTPEARNVAAGNSGTNVSVTGSNVKVIGNYIGIDKSGTKGLNLGIGLDISQSTGTIVGGADANARNVISGAKGAGLFMAEGEGALIQGNYVGTSADGTTAVENNRGFQLGSVTDLTIGGTTAALRNVISGNKYYGIELATGGDRPATGNKIQGNYIGVDASGDFLKKLPNGADGISFGSYYGATVCPSDNTIGGTDVTTGKCDKSCNVIAYNKRFGTASGAGVSISCGTGNAVLGNSIFENDGLPIELLLGTVNNWVDGLTPNDEQDADTGPNNLQNHPLVAMAVDSGTALIHGSLSSEPGKKYRIEIFRSNSCSEKWAQTLSRVSLDVTTDADGDASFDIPASNASDFYLTATATDEQNNTSEVSACSPLELYALEVTQGIQSLKNESVFVSERDTIVRAHLRKSTTSGKKSWDGVEGELIVRRGGDRLIALKPMNIRTTVTGSPNQMLPRDGLWFAIPRNWATDTLDFELRGAGEHAFGCTEIDLAGTTQTRNCKVSVAFKPRKSISLLLVPVVWKDGAKREHRPTAGDLRAAAREVRHQHPLSSVSVQEAPTRRWDDAASSYPIGNPKLNALLKTIDPGPGYTMAVLADYQSFRVDLNGDGKIEAWEWNPNGQAKGTPSRVAATYATDATTVAHELGHCFGLTHVACGVADQNPRQPFSENCRVSRPAVDKLNRDLFAATYAEGRSLVVKDGLVHTELMGYFASRWITRQDYDSVYDKLRVAPPAAPPGERAVQAVYVVSGEVGPDGVVTLDPIFTVEAELEAPSPGSYELRFEDAAGALLSTTSFAPDELTEQSGQVFVLTVPWVAGVSRVAILRDGVLVSERRLSSTAPTISVQDVVTEADGRTWLRWTAADADGDPLSYRVEWSRDGGASWLMLTTLLPEPAFEVYLDTYPAAAALFRVLASDGLRTVEGRTATPLTIPEHGPVVTIDAPLEDEVYSGNQLVILKGSAIDLEDGTLPDTALTWSSDVAGALGSGAELPIGAETLAEGSHTLTLAAQDSTARAGWATRVITILREAPADPVTLSIGPAELPFIFESGGALPAPLEVGISHSGPAELAWTAAADQPWIGLDATSGTTPATLSVSVDPSGFAAGAYFGSVRITAPGAEAGTPAIVLVTLAVDGGGPFPVPLLGLVAGALAIGVLGSRVRRAARRGEAPCRR